MAKGDRKDRNTLKLTLRLYKFAGRHWLLIVCGILAGASYGALEMYYITLIRPFLDAFTKDKPPDAIANPDILRSVAVQSLWLVAPVAVTCWLSHYLRGVIVWKIVIDIRNAICRALLPQSLRFFEDRRGGEFISRITNDVTLTEKALNFLFGDLYRLPVKLVAALAVAFWASWQLAVFTIVLAPLLVLPLHVFGRRIRRAGRKGLERLADVTDAMAQMFSGIRIVKAFKMEDAEAEDFSQINVRFLRNMKRAARNRAHGRGVVELFVRLILAGVLFIAGPLMASQYWGLTPGDLGMFVGALWMGLAPFKKLIKCYNNLQEAAAGGERIFETIDLKPEIVDHPGAFDLDTVKEGVRFDHVTFAYGDKVVLRDICLEVPKGQTVAIVGRSGAGKSTLMDLVLRFYDPTEGSVLIDGRDVREIRRDSLLDRIAVVAQQTFLFNRTIAENIRYGRRDAADEEVYEAARAANIHEFIVSLPEGYETMCGDFGVRMSGGQRQRIAIARALLKNADILILDEAMAGLDSESMNLVRAALVNLMRGRSTFVVSHDLTTIRNSDQIVVVAEGEIVQRGSHDELVNEPGEYSVLYQHQLARGGEPEAGPADSG